MSRSLTLTAIVALLLGGLVTSAAGQGEGGTTFTTTFTSHDNFVELSATERIDTFLTRLLGDLEDGTGVVDVSLAKALDDPIVQAAVQAADTQLRTAGALQIAGPLRESLQETPLGSSDVVTETLNHTDSTMTVTTTIGPADILIGDDQAIPFHVAAGNTNIDVHTHFERFIDRLTTTTTTFHTDETDRLVGLLPCARPAALARTVLALTGDPAPGAGMAAGVPAGSELASFGTPALADDGSVAAFVKLRPTKLAAIYVQHTVGGPALPAVQGGAAPGLAGAVFKKLADPLLSPGGQLAFVAVTAGGPLPGVGIWTDAFGPLARVLAVGGEVPGLGGAVLKKVRSISLRDGELLVLGSLAGAGVSSSNDAVLLRLTATGADTPLRKGASVAGSTVKKLAALLPVKGSPGHGRTHGTERIVAKVKLADGRDALVDATSAHPLASLLAVGDAAPDVAPSAVWKKLGLPAGGNDLAGDFSVVFGTLQGAPKGKARALAFGTGATFTVFAATGDVAPAAGGAIFKGFTDPVLSEAAKPAFLATLKGNGVSGKNKVALYWGPPTAPAVTARLGDTVPDLDGQPVAGSTWKKFVSLALPGCLEAGPIFLAQAKPGGLGLWVVDSHGGVRGVLRVGTTLPAGGSARTIKKLAILNAPKLATGAVRSYNHAGSVAAQVLFTDKTQALVRIDIP